MTNQLPYEGPLDDDQDAVIDDGIDQDADRPLDPDLDDDQLDSAAADERAATEGTLDVEDLP